MNSILRRSSLVLAFVVFVASARPALALDVPASLVEVQKLAGEISDPNFKAVIQGTHAGLALGVGMKKPTQTQLSSPLDHLRNVFATFVKSMESIDTRKAHEALPKVFASVTAAAREVVTVSDKALADRKKGIALTPADGKALDKGLLTFATALTEFATTLKSIESSLSTDHLPADDKQRVQQATRLIKEIQRAVEGK